MSTTYKIIEEWAAPVYIDHKTSEELYVSSDSSWQRYWVVGWDEDEQEIIEWLEDFTSIECAIDWLKEYKSNKGE